MDVAVLLDYWLAARVGLLVRWIIRRGGTPVETGLTACAHVGRGETVTGPDLAAAMDFAFDMWLGYVMIVLPVDLLSIPLMSIVPHQVSALVFACILGAWVFGASSMVFALVRSANYIDIDRTRPGSRAQAFVTATSRPRARDSIVSAAFAAIMATVAFINVR